VVRLLTRKRGVPNPQNIAKWQGHAGLIVGLCGLLMAPFWLSILATTMTREPGHDEQMYCTAGVLLSRGQMIYRDFSYVAQPPCHALALAGIYRLTRSTQYLLLGRLFSAVCQMLIVLLIYLIYRRSFAGHKASDRLLALWGVFFYVFNPFVDYAIGPAWNHDMVVLSVLSAYFLFITGDFSKNTGYWRIGLIGALLTLATWSRITTAIVEIIFLTALLAGAAKTLSGKLKNLAAFFCGAAIVSAFPIYIISLAPRAFWLNVIKVPFLNAALLEKSGITTDKLSLLYRFLTTYSCAIILIVIIFGWLVMLTINRVRRKKGLTDTVLGLLLAAGFGIIAFTPPVMWKQYLGVWSAFLVIAAALPLGWIKQSIEHIHNRANRYLAGLIMITLLTAAVAIHPAPFIRIPNVFVTERWTPVKQHKIAQDIASKAGYGKRILTLSPLLALEGGCKIYPQLSAGQFLYRVADFMQPGELTAINGVGPNGLPPLISKLRPDAVVVGTNSTVFDRTLVQAAVKPGWTRKSYGQSGPYAYFCEP